MKITSSAALVTFVVATGSLACSASSSSDRTVSTTSALSALRNPTGTFSKATGREAFASYDSKRSEGNRFSGSSATSTGGGSTTAQSLRFLDTAEQLESRCSEGEACACPGGGSVRATHEATADGDEVQMSFDACVFEDGGAFDGQAMVLMSKKPLVDYTPKSAASGDAFDGPYQAMLVAAKGVATHDGAETPLELALLVQAGYAYVSVTVPDGNVVVGVTDDGKAIVKAKDATWTCSTSASSYSCESDSGETIEIDGSEDLGGEADEGATASAGAEEQVLPPEEDEGF